MAEGSVKGKEAEVIKTIGAKYKAEGITPRAGRAVIVVNKKSLTDVCQYTRELGYDQLSAISVTDQPADKAYEVSYHLWSPADKVLLTVKTKTDRQKPVVDTVTPVWPSAQIHERESHELFGIEFSGNDDLKPLFLEDWSEPPPLRKDFNSREYAKEQRYNARDEEEKGYWQEMPLALCLGRESIPEVAVNKRVGDFREVELGYDQEMAKRQAARCLECGDPRCVKECPAHLDIPKYVIEAAEGKYKESLQTILERLPFPAVIGRICPHPCEEACTLVHQFEPVSIRAIKRFVADQCQDVDWYPKVEEKKEERVAVIGAGPAGLTVARNLALAGYQVTVYDESATSGGMFVQSIPDYRLPTELVSKGIDEIKKLGVKLEKATLGKDMAIKSLLDKGFQGVFIGIGAHKGTWMGIPGEDLKGVYEALELLKDIKMGKPVPQFKGKKVVVVGGGNVAMDAVRSALRLGTMGEAEVPADITMDAARVSLRLGAEVTLVYRRSWEEMPAAMEEVEASQEEGVKFHILTNPTQIIGDKKVTEVECIRMELGEPDASGRRRPVAIKGSEFKIPADIFIEAIGEIPESEVLMGRGVAVERGGTIKVDEDMQTNLDGVFAAGDVVTGPSIAIEAVAGGIKAAESIDRYLQSKRERK